ncbi:MAG: Uma2 family endonuclease, partial [Flavobacterium sp.]|nr:Uma2 family endonuclease [Flavobacterium sp.]
LDLNGSYTYADYLLWQFSERLEIIKGKIFEMSPAPSRNHQQVSLKITRILDRFFEKSLCELYIAPFDVRLINYKKSSPNNQIFSVIQPDLCVVCDLSKLDEQGCLGAPNVIVEILSEKTFKKDLTIKFDLYEENGVQEYWIVNPAEKNVFIYVLKDGKYIGSRPFILESEIQSPTFPDLKFEVDKMFE